MTEALHPANVLASSHRPPLVPVDNANLSREAPSVSLPVDETQEEDDGEIACICAYTGDDGATIQCDNCLRWQHISCYYPDPAQVPLEDQKHYCTDCVPQPGLDARRATELQRRNLDQPNGSPGIKKTIAKSSKKKIKESPALNPQPNGWSHIHTHDRKSASPRDQPPPAKKPKTSHRSSNSVSHASNRKRAGTSTVQRSPSKSPELNVSTFIPHYSDDFMNLFQSNSPQVETDTNLMNNIAVTNSLSDWLVDPEAVGKVTGGLTQSEIFKRWDGRIEDIPGRPEVSVDWVEDTRFATDGMVPRWPRLSVDNQIAQGTLIGELRGRVGHRDEYLREVDGRWQSLHHPEPFVFFHPQLPIYIDARQEGSNFRFVRRSCQPNAELQTIITEGTEYHFCFMAKKDIMAGEEVTLAWQVPDTIRERINSSLATSNNFQPKVRDYISTWVSNVLANCGPCACNGQSSCLMAHYDRRGLSPPLPATKPPKRKKKLHTLDTTGPTRSRSASEVRKTEPEDGDIDSRSASGSRASASRDITPSIHMSGATAANLSELSEREKKKLMREEEMFRRQAEESGRQRKKRSSGGSALVTPSATTTMGGLPAGTNPAAPTSAVERNGHKHVNGVSSKFVDAATSTRPQHSSRSSSGKRKGPSTSKVPRRDVSITTRPRPDSYVDVGVQCDLDDSFSQGRTSLAERPRRRYVSITQRLLERCISNNIRAATPPTRISDDTEPQKAESDEMSIDSVSGPNVVPSTEVKEILPTIKTMDGEETVDPTTSTGGDEVMTDVVHSIAIKQGSVDPASRAHAPPDERPKPLEDVSEGTEDALKPSSPTDHPVMSVKTQSPTIQATTRQTNRPTMHLEMPPPSMNMSSTQPRPGSTPSLVLAQSPTAMTPGAFPGSLFSPSVTSAISPSPIRKKLSLSDYTKRSKAKESTGAEGGPSSGLSALSREAREQDNGASENAISSTPSPSRELAKAETVSESGTSGAANGDVPAIATTSDVLSMAEEPNLDTDDAVTADAESMGATTIAEVPHVPVAAMTPAEGIVTTSTL